MLVEYFAANNAYNENTVKNANELSIKTGVAIQDVAKFMGDYSLKFIACKMVKHSAGNGYG